MEPTNTNNQYQPQTSRPDTAPIQKVITARSSFFIDSFTSWFAGALSILIFMLADGPIRPFVNGVLVIVFLIILIIEIKSSIEFKKMLLARGIQTGVDKKPFTLTSLSLLTILIIPAIYSLTCTGKFCELVFFVFLGPVVGSFIFSIIYTIISPNPKKQIIFLSLIIIPAILTLIQ